MKKIITLIGCVALAASALAEGPVSANVVGYTKVALGKGLNMIGLNFEEVCGGQEMNLQELIPGTTAGFQSGTSIAFADSIQIWDLSSGQYKVYFLHSGAGVGNAAKANKWVENVTGSPIAANVMVGTAEGLFFASQGGTKSATLAGQVIEKQHGLKMLAGLNAAASPFPVKWYLNGTDSVGAPQDTFVNWATSSARKGTSISFADSIQVWDPVSDEYKVYFLHSGAGVGNAAKANKWVENVTGAPIATGLVINLGQGFFYVNGGSATLDLDAKPTYDLSIP